MKKQKIIYFIILLLFTCLLIYISMPNGEYYYGSQTDWLSQHVQIAQHMREQFYESGNLINNYSWLGGGSNVYMLAYYGLLRPDILITFLLPMFNVQDILITYSILTMIISVQLCFLFLQRKNIQIYPAFIASILFACCNCFFQIHRQLMFINYMPFLLLMFMGIDRLVEKKRKDLLIISFFFFILHSFYFSLSGLIVGFLYLFIQTKNKKIWLIYTFCIGVSIMMTAILLLPCAYTILEHKKDNGINNSLQEAFSLNLSFSSLLYSPYGCGGTIFLFYTLLYSLKVKTRRTLSIFILIIMTFTFIPYLLNATLYTRTKILIPFLPLIIFLTASTLEDLCSHINKQDLLLLCFCFIPLINNMSLLHILDFLLLCITLFLAYLLPRFSKQIILTSIIMPVFLFLNSASKEEFPSHKELKSPFTKAELHTFYQDTSYRFDSLYKQLNSANETLVNEKQTTMYASIMNTLYSQYYYDIINNPIRIKNRVALLASNNPFHAYLMGIRYIQTDKLNLPYGYTSVLQKENQVLAKNNQVLPLAYASSSLYNKKIFSNLSFPYHLDTLSNNTIVDKTNNTSYISKIKPYNIEIPSDFSSKYIKTNLTSNGYQLIVDKDTTFHLPIPEMSENDILIIRFHIETKDENEATISINNIRNRLSSKNANYPNDNHNFTYILSSNTLWDELKISLSKGIYTISKCETYKINGKDIKLPNYVALENEKTKNHEVLKGIINWEENGYFVTSLPYQKGYQAYIDGKLTEIEIVNTAFVGFPLQAGKHKIVITFTPPLKKTGMLISIISISLFIIILFKERKQYD